MIRRWPGSPTRTLTAGVTFAAIAVVALAIIFVPELTRTSVAAGPTPTPARAAGATGGTGPGSGSPGVGSSPAPAPTPTATPLPTPTPSPSPVAATIDGVWLPADQAAQAVRLPLAVMIDDSAPARPQSGLAEADLIYQAPAEGGIPRYMLVFQAGDASSIGPIRSARRYFAGWASEWRALYAHVGGAPNALAYVAQANGSLLWNADEFAWAPTYMWRITERFAPHNVYTSSAMLRELAAKLGGTSTFSTPAWTFSDEAPLASRPSGGTISVPYLANGVSYRYDRTTNRYPRYVSNGEPQMDATTNRQVAPANVIVQFVAVGPLANAPGQPTNEEKGRLELGYIGTGRALIFRDGRAIAARWSKSSDGAPTEFVYASGFLKGSPVPLVPGQIVIQVVPLDTNVTYELGTLPASTGRLD